MGLGIVPLSSSDRFVKMRWARCASRLRRKFKPTVINYTRHVESLLVTEGIARSEAETCSEMIIAQVMGESRLNDIPPSTLLTPGALKQIESLAKRRLSREPLQYILGEWDIGDLTLDMRAPVFIPRPETEELIGHVSDDITKYTESDDVRVLEVGCGSGAICLNLLHRHPSIKVTAIDKSADACSLTWANARKYSLHDRLNVVQATAGASQGWTRALGTNNIFDIIVSNPPYIPSGDVQYLQPEILWHEDHGALDGGECGMSLIRHILHRASSLLKHSGSVWLEVGLGQAEAIESYVSHHHVGLMYNRSVNDFTNRQRFCQLLKH